MTPETIAQAVTQLDRIRTLVGAALTPEQQIWVSQHYSAFPAFIGSTEGKAAVADLVKKWIDSTQK